MKIEFKIPNNWNTYLDKILENINIENSTYKIKDDETHLENNKFLFQKETYKEKEFKKLIKQTHYIIQTNIEIYQKDNLILTLKVIDSTFTEITTNEKLLNQIKQNIEKYNFTIEEIK